nr:MAG TPA: hypothetical protein [Caudoviricetes sp.]
MTYFLPQVTLTCYFVCSIIVISKVQTVIIFYVIINVSYCYMYYN